MSDMNSISETVKENGSIDQVYIITAEEQQKINEIQETDIIQIYIPESNNEIVVDRNAVRKLEVVKYCIEKGVKSK